MNIQNSLDWWQAEFERLSETGDPHAVPTMAMCLGACVALRDVLKLPCVDLHDILVKLHNELGPEDLTQSQVLIALGEKMVEYGKRCNEGE